MSKETLKQKKRDYYLKNKTLILEKAKVRYLKVKEHMLEYQKIYRVENKDLISKKQKVKRTSRREEAIKFLGGKCSACGNVFNNCCYDFHHVDPTTKSFHISANKTISKKAFWNEISKCILLCANCHRMVHNESRNKALREDFEDEEDEQEGV